MTRKTNIPNVGIASVSDYSISDEEEKNILAIELQAENDVNELKQTSTVNFRWSEFEIKRAKKIAQKLGMPYQTYIKSTLKQAMDNDEKRLN